jgi:short-subunit dehydrogenase
MTQKKTALITGASGGIGYELAKLLARDCGVLVLVARSRDRLLEVKRELEGGFPVSVKIIVKDLSLPDAAEEIYRELESENIRVEILVNNAGIGWWGAFVSADWKRQADTIMINMLALTHLTRLFAPGMVSQGAGKILNVASTAAFQPGPLMAVYYASKAYVLSFSEALAFELRGTGVSVTALCPGATTTGFQRAAAMEHIALFKMRQPASAADVARYGYDAMMKGKIVAIHGLLNRIVAFSVRFLPRKLLPSIMRRLHERV